MAVVMCGTLVAVVVLTRVAVLSAEDLNVAALNGDRGVLAAGMAAGRDGSLRRARCGL